jgi:hypothetical protein
MKILDYKINTWSFFDLLMLRMSIFIGENTEEKRPLREVCSNTTYLSDEL